ncbi:MAG: hypothetical protein K0B11_15585 [Mariniphaga sp.]|nr:hypothetical protein [Mariniphaga sp.]
MKATKNIRLLIVMFDFELEHNDIHRFRGAVIETTRRKNDLFHNHSETGSIYRYPLIQYKRLNRKAALLCIEEGIEGLQDFFAATNWQLDIGDKKQTVKVENLRVRQHRIGVWEKPFRYTISRWLPLNQENYRKYHQLEDFGQKTALLEKIMLANILSFLQGINLYVEEHIEVKMTEILAQRIERYKNQEMQAFSLEFETNVSLPNFIGLGKGSSSGFGVIKELKNYTNS